MTPGGGDQEKNEKELTANGRFLIPAPPGLSGHYTPCGRRCRNIMTVLHCVGPAAGAEGGDGMLPRQGCIIKRAAVLCETGGTSSSCDTHSGVSLLTLDEFAGSLGELGLEGSLPAGVLLSSRHSHTGPGGTAVLMIGRGISWHPF